MSNTTSQDKHQSTDRLNPYLGKERIEWLNAETKRQGLKSVSELLRRIIDELRRDKRKEVKP
ncbi:MAG: hypothetical protein JL50_10795 [Peptococcaceae bacterium BICA1-7]|nr:MAG: hypothetical protein JL50_10795 [Peptococcaceae bacterium BICA1-7]HBV95771.1 hypothetical protein [Desulfotomaculum sp.]